MAIVSLATYIGFINGNHMALSINKMSSGRVSSVQTLVKTNGIALFGQNVDRTSKTSDAQRVLDNSYAYMLLYYGPIIISIIAYIYRKGMKKIINEKDYICALFLALYNAAGLMEHFSLEVATNPFMLSISELLYDEKKAKKIGDSEQ